MRNIIEQKPSSYAYDNLYRYRYVAKQDIQNKVVLDIGCGYGWFEHLSLKNGVASITGTEITEEDLTTAKKYVTSPKATFSVASALDLPFPDNSFDTVVSWEVLEHIPKSSEEKMFKEVNRVLKKDGVFYLSTPYRSLASMLLDPAWLLTFGGHRHYSRQMLSNYAESSKMQVVKMQVKGGLISLISVLNMYFSKWILRRGPVFEAAFTKMVKKDLASDDDKLANIYCVFKKANE